MACIFRRIANERTRHLLAKETKYYFGEIKNSNFIKDCHYNKCGSNYSLRSQIMSETLSMHSSNWQKLIAMMLAIPVFGIHIVENEASPSQNTVSNDYQVQINPDDLKRADENEVVSNNHTARWRVFTDTGRDMFTQGRTAEAEKYFDQALIEAKLGFGQNDPHVASACNNMAEFYRVTKQYEKAEPLYSEAIERLKFFYGPDHHSVGLALHNLGGFYLLQQNIEKAKKCYEEAVQVKAKTLGPHHPEYASSLFHLGEVLRIEGKFSDAKAIIEDSIKILEILFLMGDFEESEKLQRKLLHSIEITQGSESLAAAMAAENLSSTLKELGKFEESFQLLQRALNSRGSLLSANNFLVGITLFKIAELKFLVGNQDLEKSLKKEAMEEFEGSLEILERSEGILKQQWQATLDRVSKISSLLGETKGKNSLSSPSSPAMAVSRLLPLVNAQFLQGEVALRLFELKGNNESKYMSEICGFFLEALKTIDQASELARVSSHPEIVALQIKVLKALSSIKGKQRKGLNEAQKEALEKEIEKYLIKVASLEAVLKDVKRV